MVSLFILPIAKNYVYSDGINTTAIVMELDKVRGRSAYVCSITAKFETPAGSVTHSSPYADSSLCHYRPGQVIDITYSQSNPSLWRPSGIPQIFNFEILDNYHKVSILFSIFALLCITLLAGIIIWRTRHSPGDTETGRG